MCGATDSTRSLADLAKTLVDGSLAFRLADDADQPLDPTAPREWRE